MKKFLLFFCFFLALCAFFHKALLGLAVQRALKSKSGCELAYRSIHWEEGDLVFSDLVVFDPAFHAYIEKAYFHIDWKSLPHKLRASLVIDRPRLSFVKVPQRPVEKSSWLDLTISINDGIVEWDGLARFSYDQNHLMLDWDGSGLDLSFYEEGVDAEFKQFNLRLFNSFLPSGEILEGTLTGRICLDLEQSLVSANLQMQNVSGKTLLSDVYSVDGAFSYNADLGAKWDLKGSGRALGQEVPFACEGRGFFKSRWIESEVRFDESVCKISGEDIWVFQCKKLKAHQATFLQAGMSLVWPKIADWKCLEGVLNADVSFCPTSWNIKFEGEDLLFAKDSICVRCEKASGEISQDGGELSLTSDDYALTASGCFDDWKMQLQALSGDFLIQGGWDGEKVPIRIVKAHVGALDFQGKGWIDSHFNWRFGFDGDVTFMERKLPFTCSNISKLDEGFAFDCRLNRKTWDLLRLKGIYDGKNIELHSKSHLLGSSLQCGTCRLDACDVSAEVPWKNIAAASSFLQEWGIDISSISNISEICLRFVYQDASPKIFAKTKDSEISFKAEKEKDFWNISLDSDITLSAAIKQDGAVLGKMKSKACETEFEGRLNAQFQADLALKNLQLDLSAIPMYQMEGIVKGQGHIVYGASIEADLDLDSPALKVHHLAIENEGKVHLCYSSEKGVSLGRVNLRAPFNCHADLLEYDAVQARWFCHNASVHLPAEFIPSRFAHLLDKDQDLDLTANIDFAADFSSFTCFVPQAVIPLQGTCYPIKDLQLVWENDCCTAAFRYLDQLLRVRCLINDAISGRLTVGEEENPLCIDFGYDNRLNIYSLEGSFAGVDASFHADSENSLIGSAHVDFSTLSQFLPERLAEVFTDIKMGSGYELKGRLELEKNSPSFEGILSGKQLELFGFQFRTLLAQTSLSPSHVHIYDLKISDTAGSMKVDEIIIESKEDNPWTIAIPNLCIRELRPSLLQKKGKAQGSISPLVVRELSMKNFQGLLDESSTYTAEGNLHFINSYKRGETVFDAPANVLNRIVGLDLELLIPVCGDLTFDLKDGAFHLLELSNSYSEANRSQFFLEMEPAPQMDLDGNLQIFIKMKQFVLLKITESFLISVDGKLDDPKYHLKKRRFFGLM